MKSSPINIILLGDPTAGKATQATSLTKKYGLREFDLGDWLRKLKTSEAKKKFKVSETTAKGILAPTDMAREKFKEIIFKTPKAKGIFFNGNPKMLGEAKLMRGWFREAGRRDPIVMYLSIPKREMLSRITIREREEGRSDDAAAHLKNRMKYYAKDIPETVAFLRKHYAFKKISGLGTRAEVFKRLVETIEKLKKTSEKK
jgi:adenylate kinase